MCLRISPLECPGDGNLLSGEGEGLILAAQARAQGSPLPTQGAPFACVAWAGQQLHGRLRTEGSTDRHVHPGTPPGLNGVST